MFSPRAAGKPTGWAASLVLLIWTGTAFGQTADRAAVSPAPQALPTSAMELTITSVPPVGADGKIYVNQNCGLLPDLTLTANGKEKEEIGYDPVICHVEGAANSQHKEEKALGDELERSHVDVREQEFVLQDITMKPVVFYVLVRLPGGWVVDSDPQPKEVRDDIAVFEAHAAEGEIVHLHVGIRHTRDLKPKTLRSPLNP
jgi:hypothetical protein